jgi:hypothetical protein
MADPTVTDVFNQLVLANGKLAQIEVNTSLVSNLNTSINVGFNATVDRLNKIAAINIEAVKLLYHQTQQMDTMICMLEQISRNTCQILNEVTAQTRMQTQMASDLACLCYIAESTHPNAALEKARHGELQDQIERCCPPKPIEPPCKYEPCKRPESPKEPKLPEIPSKDPQGPVG